MTQFDEHLAICWAGCDWPHLNWIVDHGAFFISIIVCTWILFGRKKKSL